MENLAHSEVLDPEKLSFDKFREEVLNDYRLACESREASLLGRKEVLTGKAKFGIFGDGKEVPQVAMAKFFKPGDFYAGYYRDQTFSFATGAATIEEFFSQLYADPDPRHDPHSAGRQMNSHFASPFVDTDGSPLDLVNRKNLTAGLAPTAAQMPRALGLACASKAFREVSVLRDMTELSNNGNEVCFCTIGDASTSEGHFWETLNAAGVLQVPLAIFVWDDGYGISVPRQYQTTKGSISEVLEGFQKREGTNGIDIYKVKAWDYAGMCEVFETALRSVRQTHTPVLFHVEEVTQPQGHSTSGSHERYKSPERLEWEREWDGIKKMKEWIIENALAGEDELVALATSVTGDTQLGALLGQMFDVMGEHATVITQDIPRVCLDHDYIRGGKWDGYIPARQLVPEGEVSLILHNPLIVMTDEDLTNVAQVQPLLELALAEPEKAPLLILARSISGDALTMLTANHVRGVLSIGMFVLSSGVAQIPVDLEDMAALTGGQLLSPITGTGLHSIQPRHFGRARQAVLSANSVTIASGAGTPSVVQQRIAGVRAELKRVSRSSDGMWELLRVRLARLTGGIGVLKLGTQTERELETKKEQVSKALRVLELAYDGGLVPGGGVAFLACLPALESARAACRHEDETYGVAILAAALQAPFLQIVSNHGEVHPPLALDTVQRLGQGYGFDVLRGDYARMDERHILDCLRVTCGVLGAATSLATMLITTDTLVFTL